MSSFLTTIQELEELYKNASEGQWEYSDRGLTVRQFVTQVTPDPFLDTECNLALIARMHSELPQLLAMARWACEKGYPGEKV